MSHHCKGCHNPETWPFEPRHPGDVDKILAIAVKNPILQGLTFSGGEPFCQAEALAELAQKCHENGLNVMSYSGYTFEELLAAEAAEGAGEIQHVYFVYPAGLE